MRRSLALFVVQQNREQVVGQHPADDLGNIRQQLIEVERLRRDGRHFQQEVQQLATARENEPGLCAGCVAMVVAGLPY